MTSAVPDGALGQEEGVITGWGVIQKRAACPPRNEEHAAGSC